MLHREINAFCECLWYLSDKFQEGMVWLYVCMKVLCERHIASSVPQTLVWLLFTTTSVAAASPVKKVAMGKGMTQTLPSYYGPRDCFVAPITVRCSGFDYICCLVHCGRSGNYVMWQCLGQQGRSEASWDFAALSILVERLKDTYLSYSWTALFPCHTHRKFLFHSIS